MPNGWGGARPGAGRKSDATKVLQQTYRARIMDEISLDEWAAGVKAVWMRAVNDGDFKAFLAVAPYLAGVPSVDVTISGDVDVHHVLDWSQPWQPPAIIDSTATLLPSPEDDSQ